MNEKNLIPNSERSPNEVRENGRKGGIASGIARREKKTVQKILSDLLDGQIKDSPQFLELAQKIGVASDKSIKEMFALICLLNGAKNGDLTDLERLCKLLGEDNAVGNALGAPEDDPLTRALKEEAERMNNANQ